MSRIVYKFSLLLLFYSILSVEFHILTVDWCFYNWLNSIWVEEYKSMFYFFTFWSSLTPDMTVHIGMLQTARDGGRALDTHTGGVHTLGGGRCASAHYYAHPTPQDSQGPAAHTQWPITLQDQGDRVDAPTRETAETIHGPELHLLYTQQQGKQWSCNKLHNKVLTI